MRVWRHGANARPKYELAIKIKKELGLEMPAQVARGGGLE
jgi:hypothetical protein